MSHSPLTRRFIKMVIAAAASYSVCGCGTTLNGLSPGTAAPTSQRRPAQGTTEPRSIISLTASPLSVRWKVARLLSRSVSNPSVARNRVRGLTYVGQYYSSGVLAYRQNNRNDQPPVCTVPGNAVNGIGVDQGGNLWVPNGNGVTIEYMAHCGSAGISIRDPNGQPADVAFDSKGKIYISNILDAGSSAGTINIYDSKGAPIGTLGSRAIKKYIVGVAVDNHDNVFASATTGTTYGIVVEFPSGTMPGKVLSGVQGIAGMGGPLLDGSRNLLVPDWNNDVVNVYAPPYSGKPRVLELAGASVYCALSRGDALLFCTDFLLSQVDVYAYPSGQPLYSYNAGLSPSSVQEGIAVGRI
jgi:hypothetical protein